MLDMLSSLYNIHDVNFGSLFFATSTFIVKATIVDHQVTTTCSNYYDIPLEINFKNIQFLKGHTFRSCNI